MLRLEDDWIWDSWIADDGETYHLFYLHAPRALRDPRLRHTSATVGHATSTDLKTWEVSGEGPHTGDLQRQRADRLPPGLSPRRPG